MDQAVAETIPEVSRFAAVEAFMEAFKEIAEELWSRARVAALVTRLADEFIEAHKVFIAILAAAEELATNEVLARDEVLVVGAARGALIAVAAALEHARARRPVGSRCPYGRFFRQVSAARSCAVGVPHRGAHGGVGVLHGDAHGGAPREGAENHGTVWPSRLPCGRGRPPRSSRRAGARHSAIQKGVRQARDPAAADLGLGPSSCRPRRNIGDAQS